MLQILIILQKIRSFYYLVAFTAQNWTFFVPTIDTGFDIVCLSAILLHEFCSDWFSSQFRILSFVSTDWNILAQTWLEHIDYIEHIRAKAYAAENVSSYCWYNQYSQTALLRTIYMRLPRVKVIMSNTPAEMRSITWNWCAQVTIDVSKNHEKKMKICTIFSWIGCW